MWIEFSELHLKLLILLIFPVSKRIQDYTKKTYLVKDNQFMKTFRYFNSYIFTFIPLLIVKYRTRNNLNIKDDISIEKKEEEKEKEKEVSHSNTLMNNEIGELKKKLNKQKLIKNIIYFSILCLTGIMCYFYRYLFEKNEFLIVKQSIGVFCEIIDYIGLSFFLLNQKLYKHHFVFAGIIALMLLILFIISIPYIEGVSNVFLSFAYFFGFSLCFGFYDIFGKKYMIKFFISPYFMMFAIGVINTILLLIYDISAYYANPDISGVILCFKDNVNTVGKIFLYILDMFVQCIWNLGIWLTVFYFTPCHYFVSEYISEYSYYMITAVEKKEGFYSIINIVIFSIIYFINFICLLFFNEVLILNFFGLDYNTRKRIDSRLDEENEDNKKASTLLEIVPENNDDNTDDNNDDINIF